MINYSSVYQENTNVENTGQIPIKVKLSSDKLI